MAKLCIPKSIVNKLKDAIKSKDISLEKLYDMNSDDAHTIFAQYVGEKSADLVNSRFQEAKIVAEKRAMADYVTGERGTDITGEEARKTFAKKATAGEFAQKNLLSSEQTKKLNIDKIDQRIKDIQEKQKAISEKMTGETINEDGTKTKVSEALTGEDKNDAQFKIDKYQNQIDKLNVRKSDIQNPSTDRMLSKLNSIKGLLGDEDYTDLIKEKMGQKVSPAQGKYIIEQTMKLQDLAKKNDSADLGVTPEYLEAKGNLDAYISNLNPKPVGISIVKNIIEIVKNNFIISIATPLKTLISGLENHPAGMIIRRISHLSLNGDYADITNDLQKQDAKISELTGDSIATMNGLGDTGSVLGSHRVNDKTFKGTTENESFEKPQTISEKAKGMLGSVERAVAATARLSYAVAIDFEHNWAFQKFYRSAFYDTLNIRASDMVKTEGLTGDAAKARGEEIIRDAARVEPKTDAGKILRANAQLSAAKILNVNDTWASKFAVGTKNVINNMIPNVPIGNIIEPFAKIPANVIANALKTTPLGLPDAGFDIIKGRMDMNESNPIETRYAGAAQFKNGLEKLIGIVGSVGIAALITSQLGPNDFKTDKYGGTYMKFGNFWINTEYFSRLAPNIAGFMAMKQGTSITEAELQQLKNLPGVSNVNSLVQTVAGPDPIQKFISGSISDIQPAILANMWKSHRIERLFFGASGVETTQEAVADANTLSSEKWNTSTSKELQDFHTRVGDAKFSEANTEYNKQYNAWIKKTSNDPKFDSLTSTQQQSVISSKKTALEKQVMQSYGFTYQTKKSAKLPKFQ